MPRGWGLAGQQESPITHMRLMMEKVINYIQIVDESMREIAHKTLDFVSKEGMQGDHHLYISFLTNYPGIVLSDRMREKYPEEITIVLQHQFSNLEVFGNKFSVRLGFNGVLENIVVPYKALTSFADPSVKFAIQFTDFSNFENMILEDKTEEDNSAMKESAATSSFEGNKVVSLDQYRQKK